MSDATPTRRDLDRLLETLMSALRGRRWTLAQGWKVAVAACQPTMPVCTAAARGLEALGGPGCWALKGDAAHDLAQRARYALEAEANQS